MKQEMNLALGNDNFRSYEELLMTGKKMLSFSLSEDFAETDSWLLFSFVTGMKRAQYFIKKSDKPTCREAEEYLELLHKRSSHIPLQYLTREQEFMGIEFYVNEDVLIPRLDTEILVETVLPFVKGKNVLDLCTGSGCIAISLAVLGEPEKCMASDISKKALEVAKKNADRNHAKVSFIESDLFGNISERFDVIVSNPPYIASEIVEGLMEEVKNHEPRLALDGGEKGMLFYQKITQECGSFLKNGGLLFFEIGYDQAEMVMELMLQSGFENILCKKDYSGLDRVVFGKYGGKNV